MDHAAPAGPAPTGPLAGVAIAARSGAGVTLIEMLLGLAIIACLLLVGMPSFSAWIQDLQIRRAAESLRSGLLLARSEAMRRNRPVKITLENADGLLAWTVGCVGSAPDCPAAIARRSRDEGGRNARMAAAESRKDGSHADSLATALAPGSGLPASIVFNGLGAVVGAVARRVDISHAAPGGVRRLVLLIGGDGLIRLCSPAAASPARPQGCA